MQYEVWLPSNEVVFVGSWRELETEILSCHSEDDLVIIELDEEERDLLSH